MIKTKRKQSTDSEIEFCIELWSIIPHFILQKVASCDRKIIYSIYLLRDSLNLVKSSISAPLLLYWDGLQLLISSPVTAAHTVRHRGKREEGSKLLKNNSFPSGKTAVNGFSWQANERTWDNEFSVISPFLRLSLQVFYNPVIGQRRWHFAVLCYDGFKHLISIVFLYFRLRN